MEKMAVLRNIFVGNGFGTGTREKKNCDQAAHHGIGRSRNI